MRRRSPRRLIGPPYTPTSHRVTAGLLATLFLTTTHLPGVVALAAPQLFARVGPGVSSLPLSVAAFNDPSFGEISDAVNVASGNAYVDLGPLNRNNSSSTAAPSAGGSLQSTPTSNTTSTSGSANVSGVKRLMGFSWEPSLPVPQEYAVGVGDGGVELYRRASDEEISAAPSWIRERYQHYRNNTPTITFISKPQTGLQVDETYLVITTTGLGAGKRVAHLYDHQGNRTTFYGDGEYADFTQTPHEQYRAAKYQGDFEGIGAAAPKTEFTYTAPGNGRLQKVKDSWGRVTTYEWDETAGVVTAVNQLLQNENDWGSYARRTAYQYEVFGGERVVTAIQFVTQDGRGNPVSRWFDLNYKYGSNNAVLLGEVIRPVLDSGVGSGRKTSYHYDSMNRVFRTSTLGEPDTEYFYQQAPADTGSGGLQVTVRQGTAEAGKIQIFQFTPEGWLRNHSVRNLNPYTGTDYNPTNGIFAGANTHTYYDVNGRIIAQLTPSGMQVQRTYDRHGNLKSEAIYRVGIGWNDPPPAGYERLTRYEYDQDNQVTKVIQEAATGQGRSGDTVAPDAPYSYGQVVKTYTYGKHEAAWFDWGSLTANNLVAERLVVDGALKREFHTAVDVYGRVGNTMLFVDGTAYKNVTYTYPADGATGLVQAPSTITREIPDRAYYVKQYGDQPVVKNSAGIQTEYVYDQWGHVTREILRQATTANWQGTTAQKADRWHLTAYNGWGQKVWELVDDVRPDLGQENYIANRQWHYYASGELNVMWDGTPDHMTDYRYESSAGSANYGRVISIAEGIGNWSYYGIGTQRKLTEFTYDAFGRVSTQKVDSQFTTTFTYDTLDQVIFTQAPDGSKRYLYTHNDGQTSVEVDVNVDGKTSVIYHYRDQLRREIRTVTPTGEIHTFYDAFDRPVKITDHRLTMAANEKDRSAYLRYDSAGNLIKKLSPVLTSTPGQPYTDLRRPFAMFEYDKLDRQTAAAQWMYGNAVDPQTMAAPAGGLQTVKRMQYDVHDRLTQVTDEDGYYTRLTYDNAGNTTVKEQQVWNRTEPQYAAVEKGFDVVTVRKAYDGLGRLTQTVDGRGNSRRTEYDRFGPTKLMDERGIVTKVLTYTPDGLLQGTQEPNVAAGSGLVMTEWREYDARSFPARIYAAHMNIPAGPGSGAKTEYQYDAAGRVIRTTLPGGAGVIEQRHHNNGQPLYVIDANGFKTVYEYDGLGQLTLMREEARAGNATDAASGLSGGLTNTYVYDAAGNLTKATERGLITEYRYNTLGQVISESRPRVGEGTATRWKITTYNLMGLPTASTSFDYQGNLASVPDVVDPWDNRVTHTAGNMTMPWYYARGLQIGEVSWGALNGSRTWEYTKNVFSNGLRQPFFRKFWGTTGIYAEQRTASGQPLGHGNVWTYWKYDQNGNLTDKWDTPGNASNEAPNDATDRQNTFAYTYTPTNKEATSSRKIEVRVRAGGNSNELLIQGGGTGLLLTGSLATTTSAFNARDQLSSYAATEQSPVANPGPNACSYDCEGQSLPYRHYTFGNPVTRTTTYSYYADGRRRLASVSGVGERRVDAYDLLGRETSVYDSNGPAKAGQGLAANTATTINTTYAPGQQTISYVQNGATVKTVASSITVGGMTAIVDTQRYTYHSTLGRLTKVSPVSGSTAEPTTTYTHDAYGNESNISSIATTTKTIRTCDTDESGRTVCWNEQETTNATTSKTMRYNDAGVETGYSSNAFNGVSGSSNTINYDLDSRGNRLRVTTTNGGEENGFIKRYDANDQVVNYHKLAASSNCQFIICNGNWLINKYNDFRYDPFGQQVVTGTSEIHEGGYAGKEYKINRVVRSTLVAEGEVQYVFGRAKSVSDGGVYFHWKNSTNSGVWDSYTPGGYLIKDQAFSAADGLTDTEEWEGTKPFAAVDLGQVMQLDAPVESLSGTLKINPLDLNGPTLPKLVDPSKIGSPVEQKNSPGTVSAPAPSTGGKVTSPDARKEDGRITVEELGASQTLDPGIDGSPSTTVTQESSSEQEQQQTSTGDQTTTQSHAQQSTNNPNADCPGSPSSTVSDRVFENLNNVRKRHGLDPVTPADYNLSVQEVNERVEKTAKSILGPDYEMPRDISPAELKDITNGNLTRKQEGRDDELVSTSDYRNMSEEDKVALANDAKNSPNYDTNNLKPCSNNSFAEGTLVSTINGDKSIEKLNIGDQVLGFNEQDGTFGFYPVIRLHDNLDPAITYLTVKSSKDEVELIQTTPEHPFYVIDGDYRNNDVISGHEDLSKNWIGAGSLTAGRRLLRADNEIGTVVSVKTVDKRARMFNLTVSTAHTYIIGKGKWVTHNMRLCDKLATGGGFSGAMNVGTYGGGASTILTKTPLTNPLGSAIQKNITGLSPFKAKPGVSPTLFPITIRVNGYPNLSIGQHALKVMQKRGFSLNSVTNTINRPANVQRAQDTRIRPDGTRESGTVTRYFNSDGSGVVVSNGPQPEVIMVFPKGFKW